MKPKIILCFALVLSGSSIVSRADETNDAPTKPNLVMTLSANGVTNNSMVTVEGTNISEEITNAAANYGKFILSSTNLPLTNFTSALPTIATTMKTNFEQGFAKLQELALPAGHFLVELKEQGRLPGVPTDSHGQMTAGGLHLSELNSGYPFAVTFLLVMNGDSLTNHYTVTRATADADWQLQRAWRTDTEGHTIIEWPVNYYAAINYYTNGIAEFVKGNKETALVDFTKAIEAKPDFAEAYYNRGVLRNGKGDLDGALADYTKAIELKPDSAQMYVNLGNIIQAKHDLDGAIADYTKAIDIGLDPGDEAAAYNDRGGAKQSKGDWDGAFADYGQAIKLQPDLAAAYYNRGNLKADKKDWDDAVVDYTKAIQFRPDYFQAYKNRGDARKEKGDLDGAKADYKKAIEIKPDFSEAQDNLNNLNK